MLANKEILLELSKISPALTNISRNHVYSVPLNYFDGLAGNILDQIKDDVASQTLGAATNPYTIPGNYFTLLPDAIMGKIQQEQLRSEVYDELAEVAPLLNTISRQMPYQVSPDYFKSFTIDKAVQKINNHTPGKIINNGWFTRSYKFAAAAVIAGVLIVSTFLFAPETGTEHTSANYTSSINIPAAVNKVSEADITEFLDNNAIIPEASASNLTSDNEVDFLEVLENTTEEDIKDYLKQYEGNNLLKGKDS